MTFLISRVEQETVKRRKKILQIRYVKRISRARALLGVSENTTPAVLDSFFASDMIGFEKKWF